MRMRAPVRNLSTKAAAVVLAVASVLTVGSISSAAPGDTTSVPSTTIEDPANTDDSGTTTIADEPVDTEAPTDTEAPANDAMGTLGDVSQAAPASRPGSTVQTRTPPPPPTTTTLPPTTTTIPEWVLPANSGEGRRAVYSKSGQRVWAVDSDGTVLKTHRVSGKLKWCDPRIGTYSVFSRSRYTNSIQNPAVKWGYMIRFTKGCEGGNIGFHEIPNERGRPLQAIWQLGQPLSAGCVRQAASDAIWMWNWAGVGTKVVVLP